MKLKPFLILSLLTANLSGISRPGGGGGGGGHSGGFGGGGIRGYGGHGGRPMTDGEILFLFSIFCGIILICLIYIFWLHYRLRRNPKKNKEILLGRISEDPLWNFDSMIEYTKTFYIELQQAWTNLDLKPLKDKFTPALYNNYSSILRRYKSKGIVNKVTNVIIKEVEIIYIDDYKEDNKDAFAVLVTGTMKDYICRQGYKKNIPNSAFSDALVFNRKDNRWVLFEIINEPTDYQLAIPKSFIEK